MSLQTRDRSLRRGDPNRSGVAMGWWLPGRSGPGSGPGAARVSRVAFTLLEMLIVIGIILALGGIVAYNLIGTQEKAEKDTVRVQIDAFRQALEAFRVEMGRWPTEDEGLAALWDKETIEDEAEQAKWRQFMADPAPTDRWGNEWIYHQPSEVEGQPYDIISPGPDKEEGTDDDISNQKSGTSSADEGGG